MKRTTSKKKTILSLRIGENLYTLAQIRTNSLVEFFDVFRSSPQWEGVNLNKAPIVFCAFAAEKRFKCLITEMISDDVVTPNERPLQRLMLSSIIEANDKYGADLVELDESFESTKARVIKKDLDPEKDRKTIYEYELTGMIGSADKLCTRLHRYVETGINWDDSKSFLFKGIPLPPPSRGK
tara:strand:+ start:64158 stop:64703 length:546 start_codon:yes stop_codon:yes gene_type:complete